MGPDNASFGWLKRNPQYHDTPCHDIVLAGVNFESENPLTADPTDKALTGAYLPFNTASKPGQVIKGCLPCSGAILRMPVKGGKLELVAWGLRNPYALAVSPEGKIYLTENAFDDRGSRPVWGAGDVLWELQPGAWYGWPDYAEGKPVSSTQDFKVPGTGQPQALLKTAPGEVPKPVAILDVHSSSNGIDFSTSDRFGFKGEAFIAQFGDMAPNVGKVLSPAGFKVVRVNVKKGVTESFAANKGRKNGPASRLRRHGLERPVSVKFDPDGSHLYIVDFGILRTTPEKESVPVPYTGVIWKVTRTSK